MKELGKRAVACKHWRWMAGMENEYGETCLGYDPNTRELCFADTGNGPTWGPDHIWLPKFAPATLGCLRALVREAWDSPTGNTIFVDGQWQCWIKNTNTPRALHFDAETEAEALILALEAAA